MILFKTTVEITGWLQERRSAGKQIGFVPTMGALHQGHISLIDSAKSVSSLTVCSIFVNPTQFNDPRDFRKYPITIEKDIDLLEGAGVDALFLPEVQEMYTGGIKDLESASWAGWNRYWRGSIAPAIFRVSARWSGVCWIRCSRINCSWDKRITSNVS